PPLADERRGRRRDREESEEERHAGNRGEEGEPPPGDARVRLRDAPERPRLDARQARFDRARRRAQAVGRDPDVQAREAGRFGTSRPADTAHPEDAGDSAYARRLRGRNPRRPADLRTDGQVRSERFEVPPERAMNPAAEGAERRDGRRGHGDGSEDQPELAQAAPQAREDQTRHHGADQAVAFLSIAAG